MKVAKRTTVALCPDCEQDIDFSQTKPKVGLKFPCLSWCLFSRTKTDSIEVKKMFKQPTCYLSPKLEGRLRAGDNRGVFTRHAIPAGERLAVWGGEVITWEMLVQLPLAARRLTLQVEEGLYLISSQEGPGDWVNHSCDPNAGLSGQIVLAAMRDIAPGEEICFDYALSDGSPYDEFECSCGAPNCRGRVTGHDWLLPELRERYAGYFSPYLQRRIEQLEHLGVLSPVANSNGTGRQFFA